MAIITVRVGEEIKKMMEEVKINWSIFIRNAIKTKVEEEKGKTWQELF